MPSRGRVKSLRARAAIPPRPLSFIANPEISRCARARACVREGFRKYPEFGVLKYENRTLPAVGRAESLCAMRARTTRGARFSRPRNYKAGTAPAWPGVRVASTTPRSWRCLVTPAPLLRRYGVSWSRAQRSIHGSPQPVNGNSVSADGPSAGVGRFPDTRRCRTPGASLQRIVDTPAHWPRVRLIVVHPPLAGGLFTPAGGTHRRSSLPRGFPGPGVTPGHAATSR